MTHGTIRLRATDLADRDQADRPIIVDGDGYQHQFGPNEAKVFPDNIGNRSMSANATTALGTTVQQTAAPKVNVDDDDIAAIT